MEQKAVKDIKNEIENAADNEIESVLKLYENDPRKSVLNLIEKKRKQIKKLEDERIRIYNMQSFEREYENYELICGIDEVGRGPLMGPVVTAAVCMPKDIFIPWVNDSKKLSEKRRDELFDIIKEKAIEYSIGMVWQDEIDEINILNATKKAMKEAVNTLPKRPDVLLIDAVHLDDMDMKQVSIIKGDANSFSIACASILAKVTRDRMMDEYDKEYPMYDFKSNKGYGTKKHIDALKEYGPCPLHRKSFIKNLI
ncbi:MAG: ribonuclease HII [Lachnospiraceae bacterium]|nr:ribonuclease HII [Lachnospiraceae bacterium]